MKKWKVEYLVKYSGPAREYVMEVEASTIRRALEIVDRRCAFVREGSGARIVIYRIEMLNEEKF